MERPMQYAYEVFRKGSISKAAESLYVIKNNKYNKYY